MKDFKKWIRAAGIRALRTFAHTALATIGTSAVLSAVDWRVVISASVLSAILSLLTSIAGLPEIAAVPQFRAVANGGQDQPDDMQQQSIAGLPEIAAVPQFRAVANGGQDQPDDMQRQSVEEPPEESDSGKSDG